MEPVTSGSVIAGLYLMVSRLFALILYLVSTSESGKET
jgi:hypothetical protein